nr:autotransporter outer membrane beta-barrel domain-containing protein [Desulfuromonadales bacterium]
GYGWYDTQRDIDFLPTPTRAVGEQEIGFFSVHARLAHVTEREHWYLRPQIDAGVTHVNLEDFREQGAGGANLDVRGHEETYVSLQPAVEVGQEIERPDGTLVRPWAKLGITHFLSGPTPQITAVFQGAPAGVAPFSVTGDVDETFADVSLGLDVLKEDGINFRFNYTGQFSEDMKNHGVGLKITIPF